MMYGAESDTEFADTAIFGYYMFWGWWLKEWEMVGSFVVVVGLVITFFEEETFSCMCHVKMRGAKPCTLHTKLEPLPCPQKTFWESDILPLATLFAFSAQRALEKFGNNAALQIPHEGPREEGLGSSPPVCRRGSARRRTEWNELGGTTIISNEAVPVYRRRWKFTEAKEAQRRKDDRKGN